MLIKLSTKPKAERAKRLVLPFINGFQKRRWFYAFKIFDFNRPKGAYKKALFVCAFLHRVGQKENIIENY